MLQVHFDGLALTCQGDSLGGSTITHDAFILLRVFGNSRGECYGERRDAVMIHTRMRARGSPYVTSLFVYVRLTISGIVRGRIASTYFSESPATMFKLAHSYITSSAAIFGAVVLQVHFF
jgi:hypothetical protein